MDQKLSFNFKICRSVNNTEALVFGYSVFTHFVRPLIFSKSHFFLILRALCSALNQQTSQDLKWLY